MFDWLKTYRYRRLLQQYQETSWQKLDYEAALWGLDKEHAPLEWARIEAKLFELENRRRALAAKLMPKEA